MCWWVERSRRESTTFSAKWKCPLYSQRPALSSSRQTWISDDSKAHPRPSLPPLHPSGHQLPLFCVVVQRLAWNCLTSPRDSLEIALLNHSLITVYAFWTKFKSALGSKDTTPWVAPTAMMPSGWGRDLQRGLILGFLCGPAPLSTWGGLGLVQRPQQGSSSELAPWGESMAPSLYKNQTCCFRSSMTFENLLPSLMMIMCWTLYFIRGKEWAHPGQSFCYLSR